MRGQSDRSTAPRRRERIHILPDWNASEAGGVSAAVSGAGHCTHATCEALPHHQLLACVQNDVAKTLTNGLLSVAAAGALLFAPVAAPPQVCSDVRIGCSAAHPGQRLRV